MNLIENYIPTPQFTTELAVYSAAGFASFVYLTKRLSNTWKRRQLKSKFQQKQALMERMKIFFGERIFEDENNEIEVVRDIIFSEGIEDRFVKLKQYTKKIIKDIKTKNNTSTKSSSNSKSDLLFFQLMQNMENRFKKKAIIKSNL